MKRVALALALSTALASPAFAVPFVNGGFESGDFTGWDVSNAAYRAGVNNAGLTPGYVYANDIYPLHSAIVNTAYVDPNVGAALGSTVYSGNHAMRVEDTTTGGYASAITQRVNGYTDTDIFFTWKAVLLGAHGVTDAATMKLVLRDETTGLDLITRTYNAASTGSGVDARFSLLNSNYYTAQWQVEQLTIGADLLGHDFSLSVLAADCQPTGHWGYVYLDGFGAQIPDEEEPTEGPTEVPEPGVLGLMGLALMGFAGFRRRKNV
jgi:hypothetical protein